VTGTSGGRADSAGVPWAGRTLTPQPFAGDDGRADPRLAAALADGDEEALASALAKARVLVPVVAVLADEGGDRPAPAGPTRLPADKNADMAVATLVGPGGRKALPVFSSLDTLAAWDDAARPVPAEGPRAALSAVGDGCDALVVDPAGPRPRLVRRPLVWALAQGRRWVPPARDRDVVAAVDAAADGVPGIHGARCQAGERGDLAVLLAVRPGLDADGLSAVVGVFRDRLAASELLAERVEGLEIHVLPAGPPGNHGNS
jgi:SseB protein N-terminal domain